MGFGFQVSGFELRGWGLGLKVWGLGFGSRVSYFVFCVWVQELELRFSGFGFRVSGSCALLLKQRPPQASVAYGLSADPQYEDLGQLGQDEPASGCRWSHSRKVQPHPRVLLRLPSGSELRFYGVGFRVEG